MNKYSSPFLNILPSLDVHGYTSDSVIYPVSDFINDNIKLKHERILIIHGIGQKILSNTIHNVFKKDKRVKKIYLSPENLGCTILELNI